MSDPIEEITPDPVAPDEVPVVDEVVPNPDPVGDEPRPGFVDELLDKMDALMQAIAGGTAPPNPTAPEMPGDGQIVPDESPVKKPWTHRGFFGKD